MNEFVDVEGERGYVYKKSDVRIINGHSCVNAIFDRNRARELGMAENEIRNNEINTKEMIVDLGKIAE